MKNLNQGNVVNLSIPNIENSADDIHFISRVVDFLPKNALDKIKIIKKDGTK